MADAYVQISCWFDVKTAKNAIAALAIASGRTKARVGTRPIR
jgi:hypothetical protein